jgi:5'-AMP-activated protein kinase regulatory gamma subunit
METTVFDVVHMFSERGISAVPIIDDNGIVRNMYETVDVTVSNISLSIVRRAAHVS